MEKSITPAGVVPAGIVEEAWQQVAASFERFCLTAGVATLADMMEQDAARLCGVRYGRTEGKDGYRWGRTKGKLGFHGGKIELARPRVRARDGGEIGLPSWQAAVAEDWLGKWAMNLMLINVSTRKFGRAVRLPEGDCEHQTVCLGSMLGTVKPADLARSRYSRSRISSLCSVGGARSREISDKMST